MIVTIDEKEYHLRLLCGRFKELKDKLGGGDLLEALMQMIQGTDVDQMATALTVLCQQPKLDRAAALALLDCYLEEGHTVMEFGTLLLETLDESGFLPRRGMGTTIARQMMVALDTAQQELETAPTRPASPPVQGEFSGFPA